MLVMDEIIRLDLLHIANIYMYHTHAIITRTKLKISSEIKHNKLVKYPELTAQYI